MKDHELRELINDVTAVAKIYAKTQQLRQQVSQLITPAINGLNSENAYLRGFKIGAEERIKRLEAEIGRLENIIQPDFEDGHDCEGFVGGCKRMGCPGGSECTELPANKK